MIFLALLLEPIRCLEVSVTFHEAECLCAGDQNDSNKQFSVLGGRQGWNKGQFSEVNSSAGDRCYCKDGMSVSYTHLDVYKRQVKR